MRCSSGGKNFFEALKAAEADGPRRNIATAISAAIAHFSKAEQCHAALAKK
jgi:hypothetical protein